MSSAQNYFDLFSLPVSFVVDQPALHRAWLLRLQELHPDRHLNRAWQDRVHAVQQSTVTAAELNHAYQVLKDPFKCAVYLLELKSTVFDQQQTTSDPKLLERVMRWRQQLASYAEQDDARAVSNQLHEIEDAAADCRNQLKEMFADQAYHAAERQHLEKIQECLQTYKFYLRLLEQGKQNLPRLRAE